MHSPALTVFMRRLTLPKNRVSGYVLNAIVFDAIPVLLCAMGVAVEDTMIGGASPAVTTVVFDRRLTPVTPRASCAINKTQA